MRRAIALLLLALVTLAACGKNAGPAPRAPKKIRIGLSMDTLKEERWQRDRDLFVARARELGAEVTVQAAAGDDYLQLSQAEHMIARGIDVLVVVPHNAAFMAPVVATAHAAGVKVIAYDRLITGADVDMYLSFNNERVGELQAEYITRVVPRGNYVYIGGAPTDLNAKFLREGAMKVLEPLQNKGDINLVFVGAAEDWRPDNARALMEEALKKTGGKVDAVVAANDGTAGGAIQALYRHGLAGRVPVSGQDAELAALRRIVAGTQQMTVYKPIRRLAVHAAEIAVDLAQGRSPAVTDTVNNGRRNVPAVLLEPVGVDRSNILETVIRDGFHRQQEVFVGD